MEYRGRKDKVFWALGPKATHQKTRSEERMELDKFKINKLIKLHNIMLAEKKYHSRRDLFGAKQTDTETPENHWKKIIELIKI